MILKSTTPFQEGADNESIRVSPYLEDGAAACDVIVNLLETFPDSHEISRDISRVKRFDTDKYIDRLYSRQTTVTAFLEDFKY